MVTACLQLVSGLIRALTRRIIRRKNESMAYPTRRDVTLRRKFKKCGYCRRKFKQSIARRATFEHLNWRGPFKWPKLKEKHVVLACGGCNSSRSDKRLAVWFASEWCLKRGIRPRTVAPRVRQYLRTAAARR